MGRSTEAGPARGAGDRGTRLDRNVKSRVGQRRQPPQQGLTKPVVLLRFAHGQSIEDGERVPGIHYSCSCLLTFQ